MAEGISLTFFIIAFAWVFIAAFTKRGKGVIMGGKIIKTFDSVSSKRKIVSYEVKVHAVDGGPVRFVGLEISTTSLGNMRGHTVSFPAGEARELAALLIEAANYQEDKLQA
jgi:hypothetical protein